jgi:hypothetical protein
MPCNVGLLEPTRSRIALPQQNEARRNLRRDAFEQGPHVHTLSDQLKKDLLSGSRQFDCGILSEYKCQALFKTIRVQQLTSLDALSEYKCGHREDNWIRDWNWSCRTHSTADSSPLKWLALSAERRISHDAGNIEFALNSRILFLKTKGSKN